MSRSAWLLAGLLIGAAAGVVGTRVWWPTEPVAVAAPGDVTQTLRSEIVQLQSDNTMLQVDNALLKNDLRTRQEQLQETEAREQAASGALEKLRDEHRQLQARLLTIEGQLTVETSAKEHLAEELISVQQEVGILQQNLAFFEQLIPDNSKPAAISIRSVDISRHGNTLRFRVLVMRNRAATEEFSGTLHFLATGTRDGSSATIPLETSVNGSISGNMTDAASTSTAESPIVLKFQQYQRASGVLAIPAGFEPKSVTVQVLEGKTVRSEHTIGIAPKE